MNLVCCFCLQDNSQMQLKLEIIMSILMGFWFGFFNIGKTVYIWGLFCIIKCCSGSALVRESRDTKGLVCLKLCCFRRLFERQSTVKNHQFQVNSDLRWLALLQCNFLCLWLQYNGLSKGWWQFWASPVCLCRRSLVCLEWGCFCLIFVLVVFLTVLAEGNNPSIGTPMQYVLQLSC